MTLTNAVYRQRLGITTVSMIFLFTSWTQSRYMASNFILKSSLIQNIKCYQCNLSPIWVHSIQSTIEGNTFDLYNTDATALNLHATAPFFTFTVRKPYNLSPATTPATVIVD
jgi:hypothetical protein